MYKNYPEWRNKSVDFTEEQCREIVALAASFTNTDINDISGVGVLFYNYDDPENPDLAGSVDCLVPETPGEKEQREREEYDRQKRDYEHYLKLKAHFEPDA